MSEIYLIRHGQASFGAKNYDKLSEKGVLQATILGEHLARLEVTFDAVYSGEMERQKKTAEGVVNAYRQNHFSIPEPLVDASYNEYDSTEVWDSQTAMMLKDDPMLFDGFGANNIDQKAFQKIFSKAMERWVSGKYDTPGMATWNDFKNRVGSGLTHLMKTWGASKRIAVFSSAGAISVATQMAMGLSDTKTIDLSWQVINASVTRFRYNGARITLSGFNDISHLESMGDKTLLTYR